MKTNVFRYSVDCRSSPHLNNYQEVCDRHLKFITFVFLSHSGLISLVSYPDPLSSRAALSSYGAPSSCAAIFLILQLPSPAHVRHLCAPLAFVLRSRPYLPESALHNLPTERDLTSPHVFTSVSLMVYLLLNHVLMRWIVRIDHLDRLPPAFTFLRVPNLKSRRGDQDCQRKTLSIDTSLHQLLRR